jgi:hypothetical protein
MTILDSKIFYRCIVCFSVISSSLPPSRLILYMLWVGLFGGCGFLGARVVALPGGAAWGSG